MFFFFFRNRTKTFLRCAGIDFEPVRVVVDAGLISLGVGARSPAAQVVGNLVMINGNLSSQCLDDSVMVHEAGLLA